MTEKKPYYIGLDCGTDSVGFAVTDREYNILKFKGEAMWGSHLFDQAKTAQTRRVYRTTRRRLQRRKQRTKLAESIFAEEVCKVDPLFFIRLKESGYHIYHRSTDQMNSLFNDPSFTDKEFFDDYPTIYHLRKALLEGSTEADPRLLYLAVHHILKNRGHFLLPGDNMKAVTDLGDVCDSLKELWIEVFESELNFDNKEFQEALQISKRSERAEALENLMTSGMDDVKKIASKILAGNKVKASAFFSYNAEDYKEREGTLAIEFKNAAFEETVIPELEALLDEDEFQLILKMKACYDWGLLADVLDGEQYISRSKVKLFEKNKQSLKALKQVIYKYAGKKNYEDFFHGEDDKKNVGHFSNYIGEIHNHSQNNNKAVKRCSQEDFYKRVKGLLAEVPAGFDPKVDEIRNEIENGTFLILLSSTRNGVIPYQLNKMELEEILRVNSSKFPWLDVKDGDGHTPKEKLISLLTFRIPYYVGPLVEGKYSANAWMIRKKEGRILPWNFDEMVDEKKSAEGFISRLTNKCTYLPTEDVLPKNSLLYSKYMVLNELNNLRINGDKLPVVIKQKIFTDLFMQQKKVTLKGIRKFLVKEGVINKTDEIEFKGLDEEIKASYSPYVDFKRFIEDGKLSEKDAEDIIRYLTIFSDGGKLLREHMTEKYGAVLSGDGEDIKRIAALKYAGWGRFSKKFLEGIYVTKKATGERKTVIDWLWESQLNLMQIVESKEFEVAANIGDKSKIDKLEYGVVDNLFVSPAVKKQIWQALRVTKEIVDIMGYNPDKVFVEVTRYEGEKKPKVSRFRRLQGLYKNFQTNDPEIKNILKKLSKELDAEGESMVSKRDRLYLYFSQLGKCMYSGNPINLDDLFSKTYDIDHIFPISKSGDDSLTNKVLVESSYNRDKGDRYPINDDWRSSQAAHWKLLKEKGLISSEKYYRLTRSTPFSDREFEDFKNRQLVETSQSTKATIEILRRYFGEKTTVVYSKASNVSNFRQKFEIIKCRSVNDLHHAKDAYLNIVVGNIAHTKYTDNFWQLQGVNPGYLSMDKLFDYSVKGAWDANPKTGTIIKVKNVVSKNNILLTRSTYCRKGQLFNLTIEPGEDGKDLLPTKSSDLLLKKLLKESSNPQKTIQEWTNLYGGYNSLNTSYFALVREYDKKGRQFARFVPITIIDAKRLETPEAIEKYCKEELGMLSPTVILPKVRINTCLEINGYKTLLTGSANKGAIILLRANTPLIIGNTFEAYVKRIDKFLERKKVDRNLTVEPEFDKITYEENLGLYSELSKKVNSAIFSKRPSAKPELFEEGFEKFKNLTLEEQVNQLSEMILYFNGNGTCNLDKIGGKPKAATMTFNSKLTLASTSLRVINTSITGLFQNIVAVKEN